MIESRYTLIDVFAARPLEGNLLAVVEDADAIDDATMATLARRFRLSETSFIQTATSPTATYRHRIFIVEGEIPFAGHPSLGTAAVWARRRGLNEADVVQQTISGEQRLHVELDGNQGTVSVWQNAAVFGPKVESGPVLAALGLGREAAHADLMPQAVSTGLPALILPLNDPRHLADIGLNGQRLNEAMTLPDGALPLTCYVVAETAPGHWRARSFGTDLAGGEDPATGSAAGAFGAYAKEYAGVTSLTIEQGIEMGCPSLLRVKTSDGVVVSGGVQIVGEGILTLPVPGQAERPPEGGLPNER
ncbi:MAG: PhzF family phenazine biosynthesis protein [Chloroflexia bacterium]|nr:PhzF family phenazine biosynthesis protein [Chloroflexia bacterium]